MPNTRYVIMKDIDGNLVLSDSSVCIERIGDGVVCTGIKVCVIKDTNGWVSVCNSVKEDTVLLLKEQAFAQYFYADGFEEALSVLFSQKEVSYESLRI